MNNPETNPWKILDTKLIYENPWIRLDEHKVITPAGKDGIYSIVHFQNYAIGILPLDEEYNTWIVGQYRVPTKEYSWEIPEGGGPMKDTPLESAKRELLEETGIKAEEWTMIQEVHTSNSATDERGFLFIARKLTFHNPEPEETEQLQVKKIPFNELYEMVMRGEIKDGLTLVAVLKAKVLIDSGRL